MSTRTAALLLVALGFACEPAFGAIPDARLTNGARVRVLADARAIAPVAVTPPLQAPPSAAEPDPVDVLRREVIQQGNVVSARFDDFDSRLYEIVGRLQLLTLCLFALFLGIFVWQLSLTREVARLKASARTTDVG